jgi:hypothetical protein
MGLAGLRDKQVAELAAAAREGDRSALGQQEALELGHLAAKR